MVVTLIGGPMSVGRTRPASRRQAELDEWLRKATGEGVIDLASLRGSMRAPTNLLQQLAESVLDSSVSILPEGGLTALRRSWAAFDAETRGYQVDHDAGMAVVADPLAACAAAVLGLVSPGRHVAILEPTPPQVVEVVRRVGGMARTVSMRPTEWEFSPAEFAHRIGPQTDLIVVTDPNPYSGQYLPDEARQAILAAVEQYDCLVLIDESARHSVVEGEAPEIGDFLGALGANCIRVDMPAAAVLAQASSAACLMGDPELIAPIRSAISAFGLGASMIAQSVLARRFSDGVAIDDVATLNGLVASGRALLLDGLDEIGVLGLGGPGGWYVPVRAKALYDGPHDIGDALVAQAGLGALPLAPFYVEGSTDPYILFSYLRDANVLENSLQRLANFCDGQVDAMPVLALPSPEDWGDDEVSEIEDDAFDGDDSDANAAVVEVSAQIEEFGEPRFEEIKAPVEEPTAVEVPEPSRPPEEQQKIEPSAEYADDDAKYRAAIAELSDVSVDTFDGDDELVETSPSDAEEKPEAAGEEGPVVLPFDRMRKRKPEPSPEEREALEPQDAAPTVFKLSVPDIASPNISTPAARPSDPSPEASDNELETPSQAPSSEEKRQAEVERIKREDQPFFFDDPVT